MKQGWEIKTFEELIQANQIGLIKSTKEQGNDKPFRYLKMDSITSDNTLVHDKYVFVDATNDELKKFTLNDGDFLFNTRNSYELVGKTCVFRPIDGEPTLFNNNIMRVVFKKGILSRFINYAFSSEQVKEKLQKLKSGTTSVVGIYYNGLRNLGIPLPPLPEQQRIVSILDECFAAIDKAKANAEQNLKNTKELFESYLQGVFEKKGEGWKEKPLKEVTTKIGSGSTPRGGQENYKSEGISLVRSMNVHDWEFRERNLAFIDEKQAKELDGVTLQEDDVLLNITGASVARCCIFPKEYLPARVNQHVSIIRPKKELLDSRFLNLLLTSESYKAQLLFTGEQGATRQAITKAQIESFNVTFPPLKEQIEIVKKLDNIILETKKLQAVYQTKITDLEELKKSILQKAFSGELKTEKAVMI